jgi:hypothetical protein
LAKVTVDFGVVCEAHQQNQYLGHPLFVDLGKRQRLCLY